MATRGRGESGADGGGDKPRGRSAPGVKGGQGARRDRGRSDNSDAATRASGRRSAAAAPRSRSSKGTPAAVVEAEQELPALPEGFDPSDLADLVTAPAAHRHTGPMREGEKLAAQALFLTEFREAGNVTWACRAAKIARSTLYEWREHDPVFRELYEQAEGEATDALYHEAHRRAVVGVQRPVVSMGRIVMIGGKPLMEREYSDTLLAKLLGRRDPAFRERAQVEHTGTVDVNQRVVFYMPTPLPPPPEEDDEEGDGEEGRVVESG